MGDAEDSKPSAHIPRKKPSSIPLQQQQPTHSSATMSGDDGEQLVTMPFKFVTAGQDARFPNMNQTKHCWQNYVDYHKCVNIKGEDFAPCQQFLYAFQSLRPSAWYKRWDDQREAGNFPRNLH